MTSIEYRLLLAEHGDPDGDRWVVGVIHWDGQSFRHSFQPSKVSGRPALRKLVTAMQRSVSARSRRPPTLPGLGLGDVLPVQEGRGGSLRWGQLRTARTRAETGDAHFRFLCEQHGLAKTPRSRNRDRTLKAEVHALGEQLAALYPEHVVAGGHVDGLPPEVRPDLSWMNGRWHHAFAAGPGETAAQTVEGYVAAAARGLMVPTDRVTLVIALKPTEPAMHEALHAATENMKQRGLEPVLVPSDPDERWGALTARIESDVQSRH